MTKHVISRNGGKVRLIMLGVVIAIIFCFVYPLTKRFLFPVSKAIANLFISLAIESSGTWMFVLTIMTNFIVTFLAAFVAGVLSGVIFLPRINSKWVTIAISATTCSILLTYLVMIPKIEHILAAPDAGVLVSYAIAPLVAGFGLFASIFLLSRIRQRLPSDQTGNSNE